MWRRGSTALRLAGCLAVASLAICPALAIPAGDARTQSFKLQSEGMRLYKEGNYRAATEAFQQVVNIHLNSFLAYYYLGSSLIAERRYGDAIDPLKVALDLQPDYIQAHLALGTAYLKLGDAAEARAEFLRVLDVQPNYAAAHDGLGQLFESVGKDDLAEKQYRQALSINIAFADAYTHLGDLYLRKDRVDEAIDLFLKSISVKPDFSKGYIRLGSAFARLRMYDEAIAATRKSQSLTPNDPDPYVALASIYLGLESYQRAESQIQAALALDHNHPGAHLILADLKSAREDFPAAEEVLQGLYERGIEDAQMRRAVADALVEVRADAERHAVLRGALEAEPADAEHTIALARFLSGLGSHLRASELLLEAAALLAGDPIAPDGDETADRQDGAVTEGEAAAVVPGETVGAGPDEPVPADEGSADAVAGTAAGPSAPETQPAAEIPTDPTQPGPEESSSPMTEEPDPLAVAEVRFEAAVELLAARHYADAVNLFYSFHLDESLDTFDDGLQAAARFNLGVARAALGLHDEAIAIFKEYIDKHPIDPQAYLYLGNAYLRTDRIEDARAAYLAFLEHSVGAPEAGLVRRLLKSLDEPRTGESTAVGGAR